MRTDDLAAFLPILFDKHHVTPCGCAQVTGIIVRISRPNETVIGNVIPFFAGDLTCFAPDANGWIGEKSNLDLIAHIRVAALICTVCAFADHKNQIRNSGTQETTAQARRF